MNVAEVIQSFETSQYTVTRRAAATYSDGVVVPGSTSSISVDASVQPATGQDLLRLPEGRRTNETRVVFTDTQLKAGREGAANEADLVSIDGEAWEVQHVEAWRPMLGVNGSYFRCIVQSVAA